MKEMKKLDVLEVENGN